MIVSEPKKPSAFAPADRKCPYVVREESELLKGELVRCSVLDVLPEPILVLNDKRQIVFANKALLTTSTLKDDSSILGLRPGEMLGCVHAKNDSGGCGTTEFCKVCGAVNAVLHTITFHKDATEECSIISSSDKAHNFRVWTSPFVCRGNYFTLLVLRDIADEVYRSSMERIFFHDVINIISGLYGLLSIVKDSPDDYRENYKLLVGLTEELLEQINSQKDLLAAEDGSICVSPDAVSSSDIMQFVITVLGSLQVATDKTISILETAEDIKFRTDPRFLKRILINMGKNALEATAPGNSIYLNAFSANGKVVFEVHNKGFIQPDIQLQIFNRFFSTKGCGRGLGTYSTKLLAEKYLQGRAYFKSTEENGTSFFLELPMYLENPDCNCKNS